MTSRSRRALLKLSTLPGIGAMTGLFAGCATTAAAPRMLGFEPVPVSREDTVIVPRGYSWSVLYAWGDPISDGPAFKRDASNSAAEQAVQAGMHHDGMHFFPLPYGSRNPEHGLLVLNHEHLDQVLLFPDGMKTWSAEKVQKALNAVGASVIEVRREGGAWKVVRPSTYARRITSQTPIAIGGPARGHALMQTAFDPTGTEVLGTNSNCANGFTPWGTYLTCEENIQNHFVIEAGKETPRQRRYQLRNRMATRWHEFDERFDAGRHPNEYHRFGWVVEIDPFDPASKPVKRTAIGRCAHESAFHSVARDGRVVIYTGDDTVFEFIYKFVSRDPWNPRDRAANRDLLDHGTLYVARFDPGGRGTWIPLAHGNPGLTVADGFADQADIVIHARHAGTAVGATPMDRPEWIVADPRTGEVYASLTNNTARGTGGNPGADAANPRDRNAYGQIIRWKEAGGDAAATTFTWDHFLLAGDPGEPDPARRGSFTGDAFGSPDTLHFAPDGTLWIGTDMSTGTRGANAAMGNNQLLAANPGTGEVRRFLTGPRGCEITGLTITPDGRTAFLNIQHPGEWDETDRDKRIGHWPSSDPADRSRSATIVITKDDGGIIGS